jgi:gluconolactonase
MSPIDILDPRGADLTRAGESLERLATGAIWSEGPVCMHEDGSVLWSDIPNNRMLRWHPTEGPSVWPERVGNLTFGGAGRDELFVCASSSLYRLRLNAQGIQTP